MRALLALSLALAAGAASAETVDASRYDAFWLWAGVRPQPVLDRARRIYLLQSEVRPGDTARLIAQRPATPSVRNAEVWMVVRVETLDWPPSIRQRILADLARWRVAGNRVQGLQIDFDARTRHLGDYAAFLTGLRRNLPAGCQLGVTGLLDWTPNADPKALDALAGVVDEIVIQTYQGRRVIPNYGDYLARLGRLRIPFRIGLLQGGDWRAPEGLTSNPYFRGYVVFLKN